MLKQIQIMTDDRKTKIKQLKQLIKSKLEDIGKEGVFKGYKEGDEETIQTHIDNDDELGVITNLIRILGIEDEVSTKLGKTNLKDLFHNKQMVKDSVKTFETKSLSHIYEKKNPPTKPFIRNHMEGWLETLQNMEKEGKR